MGYMLEIQNVHKTFNLGTINEKIALNGVNLNLNPGDFVTIIGGNGAGKSTTLNARRGRFDKTFRTQESRTSGKSLSGPYDWHSGYHVY